MEINLLIAEVKSGGRGIKAEISLIFRLLYKAAGSGGEYANGRMY